MRKYKIAEQNYTQGMLPQNRKAVFWDVVHLQWAKLLLLGAILLAFFLPTLMVNLAYDLYAVGVYMVADGADAVKKTQAGFHLMSIDTLKNLVNMITFAIYGVGAAGVTRVIRQFAWGENVHIPTDFSKGVKDNAKNTALLFGLAGLILTMCVALHYLATVYGTDQFWLIAMIPIIFSVLVVLPVGALCLVMIPVYSNNLFQTAKMALYVYISAFVKVLPGAIVFVLLRAVSLLPNFWIHLAGGMMVGILTPFLLLAWTLFCYNQFDKHLNPTLCPEIIGRGVYTPESESN